jgi:hypothetical protein
MDIHSFANSGKLYNESEEKTNKFGVLALRFSHFCFSRALRAGAALTAAGRPTLRERR